LVPALQAELSAHKVEILEFLRKAQVATRPVLPAIQPVERQQPLPLSFSQERLWFMHQLQPDSSAYNVHTALRLAGSLNQAALEQSYNEVVARHESLRTTFSLREGVPFQVINPPQPLPITRVDLRALPPTEREAKAIALATAEVRSPFDLNTGPLIRMTLFWLEEETYLLLLTMHHIISDAWSLKVIMEELVTLYQGHISHKLAQLPDLPVQYADFAVWQRQYFQGEVLADQLAYWRQQLANVPLLRLPTNRPRPAVQTYAGSLEALVLPTSLIEALNQLSQQEGATLFMTLLAAFNVLLYRYTGQEDITIGTPIANRHLLAVEGLVGAFINTLVMRTDLSGEPTFRELLRRVRQVSLEAYAHQDLPFAKLVAELQPEREMSYSPLFQVMFNLINVPPPSGHVSGLSLTPLGLDRGGAQFDLTLTVTDPAEGRLVTLEYNTDLFEADSIKLMLGHFENLLTDIVANPDQPISRLSFLTEAEQRQLLLTWNETRADYPSQPLHQLFEAQAARTPDAVAVVDENTHLTYGELNRRANQLAHYLQKRGGGPETLVGICVQRSAEMVVGLLGILKAGMAYVPLDPAYPQERLAYMLSDSQVPLLLTQQRLVAELPTGEAQVICLDSDWPSIAQESTENSESGVTIDNLAYVIYTSGSTGAPKGVLGLHRGAVNRFQWMWQTYPFAEGEVACQKTALSFVDSIWEIFGSLLQGVKLVIIPDAAIKDPSRLIEILAAQRVSRIVLVPSLLQAILDTQSDLANKLTDLTTWVCSGEALSLDLSQRFHQRMPHSRLINLYGSSEVAADSTCYETKADEPYPVVPIGRPIANTTVYLLDTQLQLVPVGAPGEIYIGGDGLARGYLHRPDLTQERFIPNPFVKAEGGRQKDEKASFILYKTGDVGRYLPDGNIEYLGRSDHQVKIRGMRIELGEIEAALRRHPAMQQAVVVAREDQPGDKRLVAYLVPQPDQSPAVAEVREFLRKNLPDYMLPAAYVFLEALPLTPNKKVDRRALPAPDMARPADPTQEFIAPRTMLEAQLARIWRELLGVWPISVTDNFFDLGGHSLLVVRLFAEIEKQFGQHLPMTTLFQAPTIAGLTEVLQQEGYQPSWSSLIAIQPGGSKPPFYCVHEFDGNAFYYNDLASFLGPDQPFYGLQAQGLDGKTSPHRSIEEMAVYYIKEVQQFQPHGPYFLGGSSLGGLVAYEMARQLLEQGEQIGLVVLFDTWSIGYLKLLSLPLRYRATRHIGGLPQQGVRAWLIDQAQRAKSRFNLSNWIKTKNADVRWRLARLACKIYLKLGRPLPPALLDTYMRSTLLEAQRNYTPQPYPGSITFFQAREQPARYYHDPRLDQAAIRAAGFLVGESTDPIWQECVQLGWGALAGGGLDIHEVSGPHGYMVRRPYVETSAHELRRCLETAYARTAEQEK
jgi:aspartate racemase